MVFSQWPTRLRQAHSVCKFRQKFELKPVELGVDREKLKKDRQKAAELLKDRVHPDDEVSAKPPRSAHISALIAERKRQELEREKIE